MAVAVSSHLGVSGSGSLHELGIQLYEHACAICERITNPKISSIRQALQDINGRAALRTPAFRLAARLILEDQRHRHIRLRTSLTQRLRHSPLGRQYEAAGLFNYGLDTLRALNSLHGHAPSSRDADRIARQEIRIMASLLAGLSPAQCNELLDQAHADATDGREPWICERACRPIKQCNLCPLIL